MKRGMKGVLLGRGKKHFDGGLIMVNEGALAEKVESMKESIGQKEVNLLVVLYGLGISEFLEEKVIGLKNEVCAFGGVLREGCETLNEGPEKEGFS